MANLNFQKPLRQSSVSHDPSEIILKCWFGAQETFLIIINIIINYKCFALYFCAICDSLFQDSICRKLKMSFYSK